MQENKAYYISGKPILNIQITLQELGKKVVYFLPIPPQTTTYLYPKKQAEITPIEDKAKVLRNKSQPTLIPKTTKATKTKSKKDKKSYHLLIKTKISPKQRNSISSKTLKNLIQQEFERASSETESLFHFSPSPTNTISFSPPDKKPETQTTPRIIPLHQPFGDDSTIYDSSADLTNQIEDCYKMEDSITKLFPKVPSDPDYDLDIGHSSDTGDNSGSDC